MFFRKKRKEGKERKPVVSSNYEIIGAATASNELMSGWLNPQVAAKQDEAFRGLIQEAYQGQIRQDFQVASEAIRATGLQNPSVLEVGCGSGYYCEILSYLLKYELRYLGIDRSVAMIRLAKANYPAKSFLTADAARLPFFDRSFDVVFNGVSLMHIWDYAGAISEASRITRSFCIFHTVPVLQRRRTTVLQKDAYGGGLVLEVIFNEEELAGQFAANNLKIRSSVESIPYNLENLLNEKTITKTYLCEVVRT